MRSTSLFLLLSLPSASSRIPLPLASARIGRVDVGDRRAVLEGRFERCKEGVSERIERIYTSEGRVSGVRELFKIGEAPKRSLEGKRRIWGLCGAGASGAA